MEDLNQAEAVNDLTLPGQITETGLELPQTLSIEEWGAVGAALGRIGKAVQWWIGDWLRYGKHKYGETHVQEASLIGYDRQYLKQMQWVSQSVEMVDRSTILSWRHHYEIAALPKAAQRELLAAAEREGWSVSGLRAAVKLHKAGPASAIPLGKFHVLYVDPPWDYANTGFAQSAAGQYPTMTLDAIRGLPVRELSIDDGVIFLWATAPLLPEAISVLSAWGYEYKTHLVWVKDRAPGMGWFLNTKHELLLIGTKGSCHPCEKVDSVFEYPVGEHSAKPPSVYGLIERMYEGPYIELFLRGEPRKGWMGWGREARMA